MSLIGENRADCGLCGWDYLGPNAAAQYSEHLDKHARLSEQFDRRTTFSEHDKQMLQKMGIRVDEGHA